MKRTFAAPSFARIGAGQAGVDSSAVRPITPGNGVPGSYSVIGISSLRFGRWDAEATRRLRHGHHPVRMNPEASERAPGGARHRAASTPPVGVAHGVHPWG